MSGHGSRRGWTPACVFGRHAGIIATLAGALLLAALARLLATGTMRHLAATVPEALDFTFALMFTLFLWFSSQAEPALARWSKVGPAMSRALVAAAPAIEERFVLHQREPSISRASGPRSRRRCRRR